MKSPVYMAVYLTQNFVLFLLNNIVCAYNLKGQSLLVWNILVLGTPTVLNEYISGHYTYTQSRVVYEFLQ